MILNISNGLINTVESSLHGYTDLVMLLVPVSQEYKAWSVEVEVF